MIDQEKIIVSIYVVFNIGMGQIPLGCFFDGIEVKKDRVNDKLFQKSVKLDKSTYILLRQKISD